MVSVGFYQPWGWLSGSAMPRSLNRNPNSKLQSGLWEMPACGQYPGKHDLCQPLGTQTTTVAQPVDPEAWVVPLYFLSLLVCVSGLVGGSLPSGMVAAVRRRCTYALSVGTWSSPGRGITWVACSSLMPCHSASHHGLHSRSLAVDSLPTFSTEAGPFCIPPSSE